MKKLLWALTLCGASIAQADYVGGNLSYLHDNDGIAITKQGLSASASDALGIRLQSVDYDTPDYQAQGETVSALLDLKLGSNKVFGDLGLGRVLGKTYFLGDVTWYKSLRSDLSVFTGINGDIVDSAQGIEHGITQAGWNLGLDYYKKYLGLTFLVRENYYSNNNRQQGFLAKAYLSPREGINVYVSTKQYTNSRENSGDFYSPGNYERYNIGLGYRYRIGWAVVSGFLETGRIYEDQERGMGNAWRISLSSVRASAWHWQVSYTDDISESTNYKYRMVLAEFRYNFR